MRRCSVILLVLLLSGCAKHRHVVTAHIVAPPERAATRAIPNLALGPDADCLALASTLAYRSSWPSTGAGYWFDEQTFSIDVQQDDQFFYDRFGAFYRTAESARTAVIVH